MINETTETCKLRKIYIRSSYPLSGVAGAGSLILEFATLSRLTGDDRFEKAAFKSFFALWNKRSEIGLVGNSIDVMTGVRSLYVHHDHRLRISIAGVGWPGNHEYRRGSG
jgi:hypothetical protein